MRDTQLGCPIASFVGAALFELTTRLQTDCLTQVDVMIMMNAPIKNWEDKLPQETKDLLHKSRTGGRLYLGEGECVRRQRAYCKKGRISLGSN